jgi:hypothetical protein
MDFNDIQSAWDNDNNENVVLPINLEKIQTANTPLDKIKKNLKKELIYQSVAVILSGFAPTIFDFPVKWFAPFYLLYSMYFAVCVYFLVKLFLFYKRINNITLRTKDSLYETYFDVRLNMVLYKTFGFALTPFVVLFFVGFTVYLVSTKPGMQISDISNTLLISIFVVISLTILFLGLMVEWKVRFLYGKYAKQIRKVIDELKEE